MNLDNIKTEKADLTDHLDQGRESLLGRVLTRRYRIILLVAVVALAASAISAFVLPVKEKVASRVFVERKSPKLITEQNDLMSGSGNYLHAQAELITSLPILSELLNNSDVVAMLNQAGIADKVGYLRNNIKVDVGLKDDIITISGADRDPVQMANLINTLVDTYRSYNSRLNNNTSREVVRLLQSEKDKSSTDLKDKQNALVQLARESGVLTLDNEGENIELVRLAKMSEVLTEAELELYSVQTLYETVNSLVDRPDQIKAIAIAEGMYDNYVVEENSLRLQLQQLENKLKLFRQEATGQHPSVYATMEEMASVRRQLADNTSRLAKEYLDSIIQKWVLCSKKVEDQKRRLEGQKAIAWALNSKATEYALLKNDVQRLEDICSTLERRIKEESVSAGSDSMNITILERADILASEPATSRAKIVAAGLIAGFWLGLLAGFILELTDKSVRSIEDASEATSMPTLGVVPSMPYDQGIRRHGLVTQLDASSRAAEAFREIWSGLYFQGLKNSYKTILVTSPQASDGKSVIASNLAVTIAHSGARVLLIDADLRRPSQSRIHDSVFSRRCGLATVLERGVEALHDCVEHTGIAGLDLLSSGPAGALHYDLLAGSGFREMLEVLKETYDRIVIDAPPVMDVADSRLIAGACDNTILVVRADKSERSLCTTATAMLTSVGANIAGVVINDAVLSKNRYGYTSRSYISPSLVH